MGFLSILGTPLGWIMYGIYQLIQNYGWALVIFIILTRAVMFPLGIKQQKSMARTTALQPKLQQLQKQYGKDKNRYQQEMMKLYEKEGVSPTAGCLPSLIPMILLFGVIDVIYYPLKHLLQIPAEALDAAMKIFSGDGAPATIGWQLSIVNQVNAPGYNGAYDAALGAEAMSKIRDFDMNFLGFNMGDVPSEVGGFLIIIPILAFLAQVGSTLFSMWQQKRNGQAQMQGVMKWMMLLMPLLSLWWGFTMPAGIGVYWFLSSALMMAQQALLQWMYPPEKLASLSDKSTEKAREKMRIKREKMEAYTQQMAEKGIGPDGKPLPPASAAKRIAPESTGGKIDTSKEKELAKRRLAEARKRMAEKYGEEYKDE